MMIIQTLTVMVISILMAVVIWIVRNLREAATLVGRDMIITIR